MGAFFNKVVVSGNQIPQSANIQENLTQDQLNGSELDFLLRILKTCTIKGEQVEMFYNVVVKLQNQYVEQTK
jgi:hypothetical protein